MAASDPIGVSACSGNGRKDDRQHRSVWTCAGSGEAVGVFDADRAAPIPPGAQPDQMLGHGRIVLVAQAEKARPMHDGRFLGVDEVLPYPIPTHDARANLEANRDPRPVIPCPLDDDRARLPAWCDRLAIDRKRDPVRPRRHPYPNRESGGRCQRQVQVNRERLRFDADGAGKRDPLVPIAH